MLFATARLLAGEVAYTSSTAPFSITM